MKPIKEFTHEELVALDKDGIEKQVRIECALDGVRMLPLPVKPEPKILSKNDSFFELSGTGLKSRDRTALERIAGAIEKEREHLIKTDYSYKYGFRDDYVNGPCTTAFSVATESCFVLEDLELRAPILDTQKAEKERYDQQKKAYDTTQKQVEEIRSDILERVYGARDRQNTVDELKGTFAEYVELAGGDEDKALKFFNKAYGEMHHSLLKPVIGHLMERAAAPEALQ